MKQNKSDLKTFIVNGRSLLGNLTTRSFTNKLDEPTKNKNSRVDDIISDEVVVYTSTLDTCIKNLHKTIRIIQMEKYTKELEEALSVNEERLLINCRANDKKVPEDSYQIFFKGNYVSLSKYNYVHKEEKGIKIDINALKYGIRIITDMLVNMAFVSQYKNIDNVSMNLSNLGESKKILDFIIDDLKRKEKRKPVDRRCSL